MLVRLMYASRAAEPIGTEALQTLLKKAKSRNGELGVSGALCFDGGIFLQVLEGERGTVSQLYHRIAADSRHTDATLLSLDEITERRFAPWAMGQVNLSRINPGLLLKYSARHGLDPYAMPAAASVALFDELVATASIMGPG